MTLSTQLRSVFEKIKPKLDAEQVKQDTCDLSALEIPTDAESFKKSSAWLRAKFLGLGLEVESIAMESCGESRIHDYTRPVSWVTRVARCEIVGDTPMVLGDRAIESHTAIVGTGHTGPQGVEGELLVIKKGDDLKTLDFRGKIVFVENLSPGSVRGATIAGGGLGVVSSFTEKPQANAESVRWQNGWDYEADGWLPTQKAVQQNFPGISISPVKGKQLLEMHAKGPLRLKIVTEGEYGHVPLDSVYAKTTGDYKQSVLLTGHMYEPGLLDNASGVAASISVSRILQELRNDPAFKRGLRHFHGQECYSVLDWSQNHQIPEGIVGHINLDTIGDPNEPLYICDGLGVSDNFSSFLIERILAEAATFLGVKPVHTEQFDINCTLVADPLVAGIATRGIGQGQCQTWHTSGDREGKITLDSALIEFATLATASWVYFIACAGIDEARLLLQAYEKHFSETLASVKDTQILFEQCETGIHSLYQLLDEQELSVFEPESAQVLARMQQVEATQRRIFEPKGSPEEVLTSKHIFPRSLCGGPASNKHFSKEQLSALGGPKWNIKHLIPKSWSTGEYSLYDIARRSALETGNEGAFTLAKMQAFFDAYAQAGLVALEEREVALQSK